MGQKSRVKLLLYMQQQGIRIPTQDVQIQSNIILQSMHWSPRKSLPIKLFSYSFVCITHTAYAC